MSIKPGSAELLHVYIDVEPVSFNRGFYTVDVRYFYRVTADAFVGAARPVEISGLCVFDKRVILFGSEGGAKTFSSEACLSELEERELRKCGLPTAVVEAVDPIVLSMKLVDVCECRCCDCELTEIPPLCLLLLRQRPELRQRGQAGLRHPGPVLHHPPGAGDPAPHAGL